MTFPAVSEWDTQLAEMIPAINPRTLNQEAIARFRDGNIDGALEAFAQVIDEKPDFVEAWNNRGLVLQLLGRHKEAIADFDRAVALRPDYAEALTNRARARHELGDLQASLADFDHALASCAGNRFAASVLHNRGMLKQDMHDREGALADFDRALEVDPEHASTYINRGTARKEADDLDGALSDFEQALVRLPHQEAVILHKRAGVLVLKNQFKEAIADYDRAVALEPENLYYYISRGNARYHLREPRGLLDFRMAFRINLEGTVQEIIRLLVVEAHRDAQSVLDNCDRHLRINPRDLIAYVRRGLTLVLLGRDREAEADLERLRALLPDMHECQDRLVALARAVRGNPRVQPAGAS